MDKIHTIIDMLNRKIPFSLARFNDGEMNAIKNQNCIVARGDQIVTPELSEHLAVALKHEQVGYWKGIPCSLCWSELHKIAMTMVDENYPFMTKAVVTTNRNWNIFIDGFRDAILKNETRVVWMSGGDQKLDKVGFPVFAHVTMPTVNSYAMLDNALGQIDLLNSGDVVVLSCGPLSRIIAYEWWKERQDCTILDVGSAFDPFTRNVRHNCHTWENGKNKVKPCEECN